MKKLLTLLIGILLVCASGMFLISCGEDEHTHVFDLQVVSSRYLASKATCTQKAKYYFVCTCWEKGDETYENGDLLEHSFDSYVYNDDASCQADGTETASCKYGCGKTDTRVKQGTILGHSFKDYVYDENATCFEDGTETAYCEYGCGLKGTRDVAGSMTDHSFTNYVSNNDATLDSDGTETACCDYGCGKKDTRIDENSMLTVTIKVEYLLAGYGTTGFEKIAEAFMEKNPNIRITLIPNDKVHSETESKLRSGRNLSDVYYGEFLGSVRRWALQGLVEPIDDVMQMTVYGENITVAQNMSAQMLESRAMVKDGINHYWSLPHNVSVSSFLYNKKLFDKYNLSIPKTTAELLTFCNTVSRRNLTTDKGVLITPITYCGKANDGYWNNILKTWWLQASGKQVVDNFSKYESPEIYNDNGRLRMYQVFNQIAFNSDFLPVNVNSKDHIAAQKDFLEGEAFLIPCGSWFEKEMEDYIPYYTATCDARMMNVPIICNANGKPMSSTQYLWEGSSDAWFIPSLASDLNKVAAKRFLAFVASDEASEIWTKHAGALRGYDYDYSSSSDLYSCLTNFQKSVCDVATSSTFYRLNTTSPIAIQGYASVFPYYYSPFVAFRDKVYNAGTPETYMAQEYSYASSQWETWKDNVGA